MKRILSLVACALFIATGAMSQDDNIEEVEKLKSHVKSMYESYFSGPSKIASEEEFLKLFDRTFEGSQVEVDVRGIVHIKRTNMGTMLDSYKEYKKQSETRISFRVNKFHKVDVIGNTGVVTMEIHFEVFKNNDLISKGDQNVSMTLKKQMDSWKVTFINRLYVESEKYVGNCVCEIIGSAGTDKSGKFATYLTVPDGDDYMELNDRFIIKTNGSKGEINRNGDDIYNWNLSTGEIEKNQKVIGNARTASTAIKNVLKYVNAERCQRIE